MSTWYCSVCDNSFKSSSARAHKNTKKHTKNLVDKAKAVFQDTTLGESVKQQMRLDIGYHFWNLPLSRYKTIQNEVEELIELLK